MCSTCLKAIQVDGVARQHFHPKHMKNSQTLKNVAEHVLKLIREDSVPVWYLPRNDA